MQLEKRGRETDVEPQGISDKAPTEVEKMEPLQWSHLQWQDFLDTHSITVTKQNQQVLSMYEVCRCMESCQT